MRQLVRSPQRPPRGVVLLGIVGVLAALLLSTPDALRGIWSASTPAPEPAASGDTPAPAFAGMPDPASGSPEQRLVAIYRLVARGELELALSGSQALVREMPNFRLAQLAYADLLAAKAGAFSGWGGLDMTSPALAESGAPAAGAWRALQAEAGQRLAALRQRPPAGSVPRELAHLPAQVPYAVAVDTRLSRLYLLRNGPSGLQVEDDFYVSVGKQGVDKRVEGDQRTPLGVYFVTQHLDPRSLEDRFGAGALPLNYPNAYDRALGRTGSGILLHGVPSDTYARPPLDSDGCVVLANADLQSLARRLPPRDTPVLIARQIEWQPGSADHNRPPPSFAQALQGWTLARASADAARLADFYAPASSLDRVARGRLDRPAPALVEPDAQIAWRDEQDLMIVTVRERQALQASANAKAGRTRQRDPDERVLRQYWTREGDDWRILAEGLVR